MFTLRLKVKDCASCGICMDVCPPRAIVMHARSSRTIEGAQLAVLRLPRMEPDRPAVLMTYPYLPQRDLCDGCGLCVRECPGEALELISDSAPPVDGIGRLDWQQGQAL